MISNEIRTAQEAYAALPFAVRWRDSHFAGTFRFETFEQAFTYVQWQWAQIQKRVATHRNMESLLWQCYLETPQGRVSLDYYLLCSDVTSY